MYPSVPLIVRYMTEDVVINDTKIPKGVRFFSFFFLVQVTERTVADLENILSGRVLTAKGDIEPHNMGTWSSQARD